MLSKTSKKLSASNKRTKFGLRLEGAINEAVSELRAGRTLPERRVVVIERVNVRAVRKSTGLSQAEFSRRFAINLRSLQDWEQHRHEPDESVRAYLAVIAKMPDAVANALSIEPPRTMTASDSHG